MSPDGSGRAHEPFRVERAGFRVERAGVNSAEPAIDV